MNLLPVIRVITTHHAGEWQFQCIEYDVSATALTRVDALQGLVDVLRAEVTPETPQADEYFWGMFYAQPAPLSLYDLTDYGMDGVQAEVRNA